MASWAQETFAKLSLEEKVGQTICFRATHHADETIEMAGQNIVGGVAPAYYDGMRDRDAIVQFMNTLQEASPIPILFYSSGVHERLEWGATPFPGEGASMVFGAARDPDLAYQFGKHSGMESKAISFDCVWTPVVDVNTNPRNPIIGTRAFSDRPELVTEMGIAVMQGLQDALILPNAKHFPGHGDTDFDTHRRIGVVNADRARLDAVELYPYRALVKAGLKGIMTGHLIFPALDDTPDLPATLSRKCIYDILRGEMGFEGLIASDSLTMRAIKHNFGVEDAAIRTFNSGHDMILHDYEEPGMPTFEAMLRAAQDGVIPMTELDASVMRVLTMKEWLGLHERGPITDEEMAAVFRCDEHMALARRIYEASVTLLENDALPLTKDSKVCVIGTRNAEEGKVMTDFAMTAENSRGRLFDNFKKRLGDVTTHVIPEDPTTADVDAAVAAAADADVVVFATMPRIVSYKELSGRVGEGQPACVGKLLEQGKRVVLAVFGTPYVIPDFPECPGCLTTYCAVGEAVETGVRVLFGELPAPGRLPIDLSEKYAFGYGLD